jgi:hypothetical protein
MSRRREQKYLLHNWSDCSHRDRPQIARAVLSVRLAGAITPPAATTQPPVQHRLDACKAHYRSAITAFDLPRFRSIALKPNAPSRIAAVHPWDSANPWISLCRSSRDILLLGQQRSKSCSKTTKNSRFLSCCAMCSASVFMAVLCAA